MKFLLLSSLKVKPQQKLYIQAYMALRELRKDSGETKKVYNTIRGKGYGPMAIALITGV